MSSPHFPRWRDPRQSSHACCNICVWSKRNRHGDQPGLPSATFRVCMSCDSDARMSSARPDTSRAGVRVLPQEHHEILPSRSDTRDTAPHCDLLYIVHGARDVHESRAYNFGEQLIRLTRSSTCQQAAPLLGAHTKRWPKRRRPRRHAGAIEIEISTR